MRALVADVWDGDPPADAVAALQALVARLRRALGQAAVGSGESGYALAADREDIDLYRFERLARAAAETTDPAEAAALYDEGLALWRGPALASLPDGAAESARWEALRSQARRGRLAAALDLGQAESALPELTALCAAAPWTSRSTPSASAPCATPAARRRRWPPTTRSAGSWPAASAPTRAPPCAPCTPPS
ncbi:hypothetical protein GCM10020254_58530 [Streptomyces goshikiensis]